MPQFRRLHGPTTWCASIVSRAVCVLLDEHVVLESCRYKDSAFLAKFAEKCFILCPVFGRWSEFSVQSSTLCCTVQIVSSIRTLRAQKALFRSPIEPLCSDFRTSFRTASFEDAFVLPRFLCGVFWAFLPHMIHFHRTFSQKLHGPRY